MAYSEKYIMSFVSERGNDYRVVILQQNYTGEAVQKKIGVAPVLSIESGDGRIQGSSLAFSIQSDTEGELRGLYTTNNKEFKALLYRNEVLYWQGYLLPELYSENYIHPPYDVAVTATDQLATLKDVAYAGEDAQTSLLDIIKNILSHTQINLQCKVHMNLNDSNGISVLRGSYISAATYNGQSCYDALNAVLLSCNCCIMQMGNQWLITSFTDYSNSYDLEGSEVLEAHATIGQMHQGDVWPSGSLNMVNAPALKGAKVDYNHTLRNSFLKNADITSREDWMYTPDPKDDGRYPGILEAEDGKKYKCFFWLLYQRNISSDSSLQLWQDVRLSQDPGQVYSISLKYLFSIAADLLLLSVTYYGDNGQTYRLTGEGWTTNFSNSNLSSYIQVTGKQQNVPYIWDVADMSKYETATVQFELPATSGSIRIGFINSTADYAEPTNRPSSINVTQVYFTVSSVTGQTATTEVEKMATSAQEELELGYGDKASTINGNQLVLNTLRDAEGAAKSVWNLSGREFPSYYMAMLQEYSRYYGSKKMQLQGVVMGKDAFRAFYIDSFSGSVMRLLSGQYNLLEDEVNISLEEVVTSFVDYDTVVYATDNKPQQNNSSSAGAVVSGGGATTLGGLINVDDSVDEVDTEVQVMIKDVDSKVWGKRPLGEVNFNEQKTSEYLATNDYLTKAELEKLFYYDAEHDAVRTSLSLIVDKWVTFGGAAMGSGSVTGATTLAGLNDVQITNPADGQSLVYDATLDKWVNKAVSGGTAGSVAWDAITGKPTFATVATSGKYSDLSGTPTFYTLTIKNSAGTTQTTYKPNSAAASITLTKAMVGLGNVENTALSTWAGTNNITTVGTITSGTWNGTKITNEYLANNSVAIAGTSVSLGGSITQAALRTALGLGSNAYTSTAYLPLSGGAMNTGAYIAWQNDVNGNDVTDWDSVNGFGLRIISDGGSSTGTPTRYATALHIMGRYGFQLGTKGGNNDTFYIRKITPSPREWQTLIHSGNIGSYNAGSATKLQTARTIWGQGFDGTGNVSGNLLLFKAVQGGWSRTIYVTNSNDERLANIGFYGGGDTLNYIYIGGNYNAPHIAVFSSGNVGIGTQSPTTKLQVEGTIKSAGGSNGSAIALLSSGHVRVYAKTTGDTAGGVKFYTNDGSTLLGTPAGVFGDNTGVKRYYYGGDYNTASMYIFANGNVSFGGSTTDSGYKLDVAGSIRTNGEIILADSTGSSNISYKLRFLRKTSTDNAYDFGLYAQTTKGLTFFRNLSGTDTDIAYLDNAGNFVATGAVTFNLASDRRLKSNIRPLTYRNTMRVLHRLRPVSFEWNETAVELDSTRQGLCDGFIADEYEGLIPNSGRDIWEKYRAIDYTRAIPYLAKGWQIHESELDKMRGRVKDLEKEVKQLKKLLYKHNIIAA